MVGVSLTTNLRPFIESDYLTIESFKFKESSDFAAAAKYSLISGRVDYFFSISYLLFLAKYFWGGYISGLA